MFETKVYVNRRETLASAGISSGLLLFLGNEESSRNYKENTFRFRQDSSFLYYFGWSKPGFAAIIDLEEGRTTFYGNDASIEQVVWMGPQPGVRQLAARVGVDHTGSISDLNRTLEQAVNTGRKIHYLPPYRPANAIKLADWLRIPVAETAAKASPELVQAVVRQRSVKSPMEVAELESAVNISRAMHIAAMKKARPGMKEHELLGIVEGIAIAGGGDMAYPGILTVNGQTLHNHYHGNTFQSGQLILGDYGAETAMNYCGDITRTFPVDEKFTPLQKDLYNLVLHSLESVLKALRPGIKFLDMHLLASRIIVEGLQDIGLMHGSVDDAVAQGAQAMFFPCGLGHMIGLDVHDMEDLGEEYVGYRAGLERSRQFGLKSLRMAKELRAGYVMTVEPGIYLIPELMDLWRSENRFTEFIDYGKLESLRTFGGIRIEDNVLITGDGNRVLGEHIPKTIEEVESLRAV